MKKDLRILLLEDAPADAELINSALRRGGFSFQAKRMDTREEFLREIEGRPSDVILSDHGLPSFDGLTALSITREKCPDTPFIFVTGSMGDDIVVKIREEFIEQSEMILLKKIEAQQKQEELWHLMTRVGLLKDEIPEPMALA